MERFPADFAFQLTRGEYESLRSQIVILKAGRGAHRKYPPYVFTEHGAVMGASVLNSPNHQSHASHRTGALHGHGLAANLVHAHREAHAGHLAGAEIDVHASSAERGEPVSRLHLAPHRLRRVQVVVDRDREAHLVAPGQGGGKIDVDEELLEHADCAHATAHLAAHGVANEDTRHWVILSAMSTEMLALPSDPVMSCGFT